MNRKSGDILLLVIGGLLLGYTAFRSMDILRSTLPADAQVLAYIGLAGLDGGLLAEKVARRRGIVVYRTRGGGLSIYESDAE